MKKLCSILLAAVLLLGAVGLLPASAAGSLSASASTKSVTIGSSVKITLKYNGGAPIASIDALVGYNAAAFEYVSCTGATANGGAGKVKLSYYPTAATAPSTVTFVLTFKAIAAGSGNFTVETEEFIDDNTMASLGNPGKSLSVSAINPTKSSNANLASLKPSSGTLTPAFNAKTTNYTITVPYTTTTLNLSATTAHKEAKTAISGSNSLQVGKNTRVITVTAANGTTKKYTVVITRSANQTTGTQGGGGTTTTTKPSRPTEELLEVEVGGVLMTVADTQPSAKLPEGFEWTNIDFNGLQVSAAKNKTLNMTLLYLENAVEKKSDFYIYYETPGEFVLFRPFAVSGGSYVLLDMPAGQEQPAGTVSGTLEYATGKTVSAFVYEDAALEDYAVVYATSPSGNVGLYTYDKLDGSMQRYRELSVAVAAPADPQEPQPKENAVVAFFTTYQTPLLIGGAVLGGLALLIAAIVLLVSSARSSKQKSCKH